MKEIISLYEDLMKLIEISNYLFVNQEKQIPEMDDIQNLISIRKQNLLKEIKETNRLLSK